MVSREELYQLVWSSPMTKVAEQFGVSGSYMARVCSVLNVPRPERGYWAKLAVGRAPAADPLPEAQPGDQLHWSKDGELIERPKSPRLTPPQRRADMPVKIPRTSVHGLVRGAKEQFLNSRPVDEGAYLKPYKKLLVDVTASKDCLDKALDFANDLFNALHSVGHRVVLGSAGARLHRAAFDEHEVPKKQRNQYYYGSSHWSPYRPTAVYIGEIPIGLAIVEMSEEVSLRYINGKYIRERDYVPRRGYNDHSWTTNKDVPSGRLRLVAYSTDWRVKWLDTWQETKASNLRSSIRTIVKEIEEAAVRMASMIEEADRQTERERIEREAAEERRQRVEDRRQIEKSIKDSTEHLGQIIQQWSRLIAVEQFLTGVEGRMAVLPAIDRERILERLKLARAFLGSQDPLEFFASWRTPTERYQPRYPLD